MRKRKPTTLTLGAITVFKMKISIVGLGYVGLSNAIVLAQNNQVRALDLDQSRVDLINDKKPTVEDKEADHVMATRELDLHATTNIEEALEGAEFVLIATPTSYDPATNQFDTSSVVSVIKQVEKYAPESTIVIKSTIPVGFVDEIRRDHKVDIIFSPEFL